MEPCRGAGVLLSTGARLDLCPTPFQIDAGCRAEV